MTNRKSTTSFPTRLRWTAYVALKPPKGAQRRKLVIFPCKSVLLWKKVCYTKFLYVKTVSRKVVRHSLAYLDVQKWLVGDVPFYVKFCTKVTHHLQKRRYLVYSRSYRINHKIYIHFSAHVTMWERAIANGGSLSVRPNVTLVIHA